VVGRTPLRPWFTRVNPRLLYDILKAEALFPRAAIDLARKANVRWT
jgi:hypothetical protein